MIIPSTERRRPGRGIPAELRERVFDKFFRAMRDGDSGTNQPSGTGLGLAIAKGLMAAPWWPDLESKTLRTSAVVASA